MSDGSMFGGVHGPENAWRSEKGSMLSPYLCGPIDAGMPNNTTRGSGSSGQVKGWDTFIKPSEGLTRGGGTMAK